MCPSKIDSTPGNFPLLAPTGQSSDNMETLDGQALMKSAVSMIPAQKRPHDATSSSDGLPEETGNEEVENTEALTIPDTELQASPKNASSFKHVLKKPKNESGQSNALKASESLAKSPAVISPDKCQEFVFRSVGCKDIGGLLQEYTSDIDAMISMIELSYSIATEKSEKSTLTKLKKKLDRLKKGDSDSDSDVPSNTKRHPSQDAGSRRRSLRSTSNSSINNE
ncbi:hypothetical protein QAD02_003984 [Eretmocerus hayati]|uniref:Uncharacterized protein n=1 Tax=Eretmocerus hayati TaxID=131215 RepID=A0ACC2NQY6_9HYME|nr:hypothetical protein QAD02_003984 [Eretmocerus hayati]